MTSHRIDGTQLQHRRLEAGLRQKDLAERAGISQRCMSHLETSRQRSVSGDTYVRPCEALGIPVHEWPTALTYNPKGPIR